MQSNLQYALAIVLPVALGAACLYFATVASDGSPAFYAATFAAAGVWWVAWWVCERKFLGFRGIRGRESISVQLVKGAVIGVVLLAVFVVGALVVLQIPALADSVRGLMRNVSVGGYALTALTIVVNAAGEEMYFRRALNSVLEELGAKGYVLPVMAVGLYVLVTVAMGVPLLAFAGLVLGAVTYLAARWTGGVVAPIVLHEIWTLGMMFVLPPVLAGMPGTS